MASKLEQLGLVDYLDGTKGLHNGNGYKEFAKAVDGNATRSDIAKAFGVTRPTVYEWINLYNELQERKIKK